MPDGVAVAEDLFAQREAELARFDPPSTIYDELEAAPVYIGERLYPAIIAQKFIYDFAFIDAIGKLGDDPTDWLYRLDGLNIDEHENLYRAAMESSSLKRLKTGQLTVISA